MLLMATGVLMIVEFWIADTARMTVALVLATVMNALANLASNRFVLAMRDIPGADERGAHGLMDLVASFAQRANRPISRVSKIHNYRLNAFAAARGPKPAAVQVTTAPLRKFPTAELAGVPTDESTHLQRQNLPTLIIAPTCSGEIGILTNIGFFFGNRRLTESDASLGALHRFLPLFLTPVAPITVQPANSGTRDFVVGKAAAPMTHDRATFTGAFSGIAAIAQNVPNINAERDPAAQVFVINPLRGQQLDHPLSNSHLGSYNGQHGWCAFSASRRRSPRRHRALKLLQEHKTEEHSLSSAIPT